GARSAACGSSWSFYSIKSTPLPLDDEAGDPRRRVAHHSVGEWHAERQLGTTPYPVFGDAEPPRSLVDVEEAILATHPQDQVPAQPTTSPALHHLEAIPLRGALFEQLGQCLHAKFVDRGRVGEEGGQGRRRSHDAPLKWNIIVLGHRRRRHVL